MPPVNSFLVENFLERASAVGRTENAALLVRAVRMAENRDEEPVWIGRVDDDLRNLLAVAQAEVRPGLAGVGGFVHAVAGGEIGALQSFAAADVDDVRIGLRDRQRADRSGRLIVEDRRPDAAVVVASARRRRCSRRCRRRSAASARRPPQRCGRRGRGRSSASAFRRTTLDRSARREGGRTKRRQERREAFSAWRDIVGPSRAGPNRLPLVLYDSFTL